MALLGWCTTGQHRLCPRTVPTTQTDLDEYVCDCSCHQEATK